MSAEDVVIAIRDGHERSKAKATKKRPVAPVVVYEHGAADPDAGAAALKLPDGVLKATHHFEVDTTQPGLLRCYPLSNVDAGLTVQITVTAAKKDEAEDRSDDPAAGQPLDINAVVEDPERPADAAARWARDVLPEPDPKSGTTKLRRVQDRMREILRQGGEEDALPRIADLILGETDNRSVVQAFQQALGTDRAQLPASKPTEARALVRKMLLEEGRAAIIAEDQRDPESLVLCTVGGACAFRGRAATEIEAPPPLLERVFSKRCHACTPVSNPCDTSPPPATCCPTPRSAEVTFHHSTGPELRFLSIATLVNRAVPRAGSPPTCVLLRTNFFDAGTRPPLHVPIDEAEKLTDAQLEGGTYVPVFWALCQTCKRWRLVPSEVYRAARKRGARFTCRSVHANGCDAPLVRGEITGSGEP